MGVFSLSYVARVPARELMAVSLFPLPFSCPNRSDVSLLSADPVYDPKELLRRALPVEEASLVWR